MPKKNAAKKSRSKAVTRKVPKMRFPGESAAYRRARDELLKAEIKPRRDIENVAALRRRLPLGGAVLEDYVFEEGPADLADTATPRTVRLSELFTHEAASLVIYSYMYGPAMANPCPQLHEHSRRLERDCAARDSADQPCRGGEVANRASSHLRAYTRLAQIAPSFLSQ